MTPAERWEIECSKPLTVGGIVKSLLGAAAVFAVAYGTILFIALTNGAAL